MIGVVTSLGWGLQFQVFTAPCDLPSVGCIEHYPLERASAEKLRVAPSRSTNVKCREKGVQTKEIISIFGCSEGNYPFWSPCHRLLSIFRWTQGNFSKADREVAGRRHMVTSEIRLHWGNETYQRKRICRSRISRIIAYLLQNPSVRLISFLWASSSVPYYICIFMCSRKFRGSLGYDIPKVYCKIAKSYYFARLPAHTALII